MDNINVLVLDIETDGLNPSNDNVLELGLIN